ncbi:sensor histidine kinase [Flavobacterium sp. I3-2]|uniref:sensor histidine kinase n=1 Tax=Flavobacterium sp. I3-2 TaxID=2748319 RepID=UPI0015A98F95|nr:sensor histidine kinase [Flavobacterium sp. I3-2]
MTYKPRQLALIIFVSIVLICIPIIGSHEFKTGESIFDSIFFQRRFTASILVVIFFYLNYFYFIPKFYFTKKYFIYYSIVILFFIFVIKVPEFIIPDIGIRPENFPMRKKGFKGGRKNDSELVRILMDRNTYQFIISFCISILLRLNMQMSAINDEKLKSEVSYLKAQINPHFLFNTLNSLYALSLEKSDEAPDAILKLSSIMRYVVTESSNDFVSLNKEMKYIEDYIDLQKLRMVDSTNFNFIKEGNFNQNKIAPLILIPFIENAFKYGLNPEKDSFISIQIQILEGSLNLNVSNSKTVNNVHEKAKTETGIENTILRLNYIYPEKHKLVIEETEDVYNLNLKINLQ